VEREHICPDCGAENWDERIWVHECYTCGYTWNDMAPEDMIRIEQKKNMDNS